MAKFDPDIVLEFYANAWPTEEDMRSWVRGQWIPFDADTLSLFLGDPLVLEEGQECEFSQRRNRADEFDEEAIAQLLCIPGQDFARTAAGRRVRIMWHGAVFTTLGSPAGAQPQGAGADT